MPPPSSGGIAVAATLGILEHFAMADHKPSDIDLNGGRPSVMGVHLISEAERLAYADRDKYVADTEFRPTARRLAQYVDQQRLPRRPRGADLRAALDGHGEAGRIRPADGPGAADPRARHQSDQHHRRTGQRGIADHHGRVCIRLVPHGRRLHPQQPAHGLLGRTRRTRRRSGSQPDPAGQAAAQHDGPHVGLRAALRRAGPQPEVRSMRCSVRQAARSSSSLS